MRVVETLSKLRAQIKEWKRQGLTVGFVPTMGNLHAGHLSLIELAKQKADKVVCSVFVNPLQFGPDEDFECYPRTFEEDRQKLAEAQADLMFFPSVQEMYPHGQEHQTKVLVSQALTGLLEGASRPGHFDGVSTVVLKLFNMVQPDLAVFGQKDYQQLKVIQAMVEDLALPVKIVAAPIARNADGLALSSRNQYLTDHQLQVAPKLQVALMDVALALESGNRNFADLRHAAQEAVLAAGFDTVDYIEIRHPETLLESSDQDQAFVILAVARLGETRLLDNILLSLG
ncbi:pantoate--beta-alanine ligase [Thiomicrorhabdus xiamenensis]|uniref:Pantothenate synthetase n=1 Tax=Thiomicrorhabdus xiamenensis TaxID=2739063 RepID=A0A7D4NPE8_9GAMM|nr:pantoate--beta-alanine ligase [Thiomicrorhabdus xiamenensis]QKI89613.1 pantoate--beta-alanine ligase [Thiomicrorhabdus xiamenensis]